jgi:hypothetical protein
LHHCFEAEEILAWFIKALSTDNGMRQNMQSHARWRHRTVAAAMIRDVVKCKLEEPRRNSTAFGVCRGNPNLRAALSSPPSARQDNFNSFLNNLKSRRMPVTPTPANLLRASLEQHNETFENLLKLIPAQYYIVDEQKLEEQVRMSWGRHSQSYCNLHTTQMASKFQKHSKKQKGLKHAAEVAAAKQAAKRQKVCRSIYLTSSGVQLRSTARPRQPKDDTRYPERAERRRLRLQ